VVAAFPVTELNRRRSPDLRVPLHDDPQTTPRQRISHITPAIVAPTSLSVRLLVSFFQWYRRRYTHCDAVESAYTSNMADRHVEFPHGLE